MPLIVDPTLSSLELPTFPDLPCLQAYDVTWNTQWDQPSGTTPEASRSVDIKPSPSPPDFSGGRQYACDHVAPARMALFAVDAAYRRPNVIELGTINFSGSAVSASI
ncbi:hypothetical protein MRX96_036928 [Rhipicephalus microplus]